MCCSEVRCQNSFSQFTLQEGLSSNSVWCFQQDNDGFVWIGTQNGLNRFDGQNFNTYYNESNNKNSLSSNWVRKMVQDENGNLWLGLVGGGIQKLDPKNIQFSKDYAVKGGTFSNVRDLIYWTKRLWVISENGVLVSNKELSEFRYIGKGQFQRLVLNDDTTLLLVSEKGVFTINVNDFSIEKVSPLGFKNIMKVNDNLYLAEKNSHLYYFKNLGKELYPIEYQLNTVQSVWSTPLFFKSKNGILISEKNRLSIFDPTSLEVHPYFNQDIPLVLCYFVDNENNEWLGMDNGFYLRTQMSKLYNSSIQDWRNVQNKKVREVSPYEDALWVGNENGLYKWERNKSEPKQVSDYGILSFLKTDDNLLFIGANQLKDSTVLIVKDLTQNREKRYAEIQGKKQIKIWKMLEYEDKIWMAAQQFFGYYDKKSKEIKVINTLGKYDIESIIGLDMILDHRNRLWLATLHGCYRIDDFPNLQNVTFFDTNNGLQNNIIVQLYEDPKQKVWLASDNGLHRYNEAQNTFSYWGKNEGLSDPKVMSILSHDGNIFWIGTLTKGLFRFDSQSDTFFNFNTTLGLPSDEILMSSSCMFGTTAFFGTEKALVHFDVNVLKPPVPLPLKVMLAKALIMQNQSNENIDLTSQRIALNHNYGNLQLDFVQINFVNPQQTRFSYKIEGLYDDFISNENASTFRFTNLPSGTYDIVIKAENPLYLPKVMVYSIQVKPAFYNSTVAWLLYFLMAFLLIFGYLKYKKNQFKTQLNLKNLTELNELKSKLYSDISHEFKTPLTLIRNSHNTLREAPNLDSVEKNNLQTAERNLELMMNLVDQMLDLATIEANQMAIDNHNYNIVQVLKIQTNIFKSYAQSQDKKLYLETDLEEFWMQIDAYMLKKILNNLISNAIKFTPEKGTIIIHAKVLKPTIFQIQVIDTGKGISPNHIHRVFDRHYRTFDLDQNLGNGIGMALCKELTELMGGSIQLKSKVGLGSTFTIQLPIVQEGKKKQFIDSYETQMVPKPTAVKKDTSPSEGYRLVIVEDNEDMQNYYHQILSDQYILTSFDNAEKAMESIPKMKCDFILSDVVMANMNGFEFCQQLKSDWKTSHIPFIIVSGKSGIQDKQLGYDLGVDAYLTKPFEEEELKSIIKNLIRKNQENAQYYKQLLQLESGVSRDDKILPNEIGFIQRLQDIVLHTDAAISMEDLSKELGMSRSQLHRKLKSLTEMSTTNYINYIKVEKAKELLSQTDLNINEIAYQLGYNSPAYFTKIFKNKVGVAPQNFRKNS